MSKPTPSRSIEAQRGALQDIARTVAAQDAQLAAVHADADPRRTVTVSPRARQSLQELCTPPERPRAAAPAVAFNEWEVIRC
jgi:hypothetical protein